MATRSTIEAERDGSAKCDREQCEHQIALSYPAVYHRFAVFLLFHDLYRLEFCRLQLCTHCVTCISSSLSCCSTVTLTAPLSLALLDPLYIHFTLPLLLSLSLALVAVMKSKELKTKTSHARSLILSYYHSALCLITNDN